jgi:glycosyltransferase involved in cell wall biosynthesis
VKNGGGPYDVAFYVPWIGPRLVPEQGLSTGGAETQVFLLSRALAERGLSVCLLVFEIPGIEIPSSVDGVDVVLRPRYRSGQRLLGKLREAVNIRAALASVETETVVTRVAGPHVGLVGLFSRRSRFVYSSASPPDFDFVRTVPKRRDRALFALGLRLADEIVVQTDEQRRACRERLGRTPTLIRSLCEVPEARPASPEAFLWIGRYIGYKRPLEYVELARRVPEARFRMVASSTSETKGAASIRQEVEVAARTVPNLELLPSLPRNELMELTRKAVAVVSTSEFEGMSNVLLEGWARGVPALVFSYDSDSLVERYGLGHVAGGSRERFVQQARELWTRRFERSELRARCRAYVEQHHAPERIAEQWEHAIVGRSARATTRTAAMEAG